MGDKSLTADGLAVGTPVYIAPEVYSGKNLTPAADVYSLGIIGFKLPTGALPIEMPENDSSLVAIVSTMMQAHAQGLPSVAAARSGIEPWVDSLIASMMVVDPAKRLQDGLAVSDGITSQGVGGNAKAPAPSSGQATTQAPPSQPAQNEPLTTFALPTKGQDAPPPKTSTTQEPQTQFAMPTMGGASASDSCCTARACTPKRLLSRRQDALGQRATCRGTRAGYRCGRIFWVRSTRWNRTGLRLKSLQPTKQKSHG